MVTPASAFSEGFGHTRNYLAAKRTELPHNGGTDISVRFQDHIASRFWEKGARHSSERNTTFGKNPYNLPVLWRYQIFSAIATANQYLPRH
ncbi:hypothetical protein HYU18_02775 [Candidatus Woesearchaeota archaeon]|nr:hypothetical protein [Candidatus Woesearchaeota archaeon]